MHAQQLYAAHCYMGWAQALVFGKAGMRLVSRDVLSARYRVHGRQAMYEHVHAQGLVEMNCVLCKAALDSEKSCVHCTVMPTSGHNKD